jgi:hypothetical protein
VTQDHLSAVNDFVYAAKRKYTHIVFLKPCEIGRGRLEIRCNWAISPPAVAVANRTTVDILTLTNVNTLRVDK